MAGKMAMASESSEKRPEIGIRIIKQWEIHRYARHFNNPSASSSSSSRPSTCPNLQPPKSRNSRLKGTWLPTSSPASLSLIADRSSSDFIFCIHYRERTLEEHFLSQLEFSWPQESCVAEYPVRGTRTVFVSYNDNKNEIQKFVLQFSSICETQAFIKDLQDILEDIQHKEIPSNDSVSEVSCQSASNIPPYKFALNISPYRPMMDASPLQTSNTQLSTGMKHVGAPCSYHQDPVNHDVGGSLYLCPQNEPDHDVRGTLCLLPQDTLDAGDSVHSCPQDAHNQDVGDSSALFPPNFRSYLASCFSGANSAQQSGPEEVDLKSRIMKYMEDSSFQDMLFKVEKIFGELGNEFLLSSSVAQRH